jgi:hypothetical protein
LHRVVRHREHHLAAPCPDRLAASSDRHLSVCWKNHGNPLRTFADFMWESEASVARRDNKSIPVEQYLYSLFPIRHPAGPRLPSWSSGGHCRSVSRCQATDASELERADYLERRPSLVSRF